MRMAIAAFGMAAMASAAQPAAAERARFLEEVRATALGYSEALPDFVCTEIIHRTSSDTHALQNLDVLTLQLTYAGKRENYKLVLAGNKTTDLNLLAVGGAIFEGEFGSTLRWIFEPESAAAFHWERSAALRQTKVEVYSYRVARAKSRYVLAYGAGADMRRAVVGFHGEVEVAGDTGMVWRLTTKADDIPAGFAIRESSTSVDYGYADVSGRQFLLPSSAETDMLYQPVTSGETGRSRNLGPILMKNLVEFRDYRKFAVDSSIDFGGDGKP